MGVLKPLNIAILVLVDRSLGDDLAVLFRIDG